MPEPWLWGLLGLLVGLSAERVVLQMPRSLLRPYQGQYDPADFQGPGGGLALQPSTARKALLGAAFGLVWSLVQIKHPDALVPMLAWTFCASVLMLLAAIDWNTTLLPDKLVLPLLWAGLLASERGWISLPISDSLWSAVGWYLSLFVITRGYAALRKQSGMADGDIKLMAAMAAWWGWQPLIWVLLISSLLVIVGALVTQGSQVTRQTTMPFGPFLVLGVGVWTVVQALWL